MNWVKKILIVLAVVFVVIQFIQPARNKARERSSNDFMLAVKVPPNVHRLLKTSCYDCHSNNTVYPWYARIQPFGWILSNHIRKGKAELNFDEFGGYSSRRKISKLRAIANSIKDGSMPLPSYTKLHRKAKLGDQQKALIIEWATRLENSLRIR